MACGVAGGQYGTCRAPIYSPDGLTLAFYQYLDGGSITVFGTQGLVTLAKNIGVIAGMRSAWSADGSKLIFPADVEGIDLNIMNATDGSGRQPIIEMGGEDLAPSWHR